MTVARRLAACLPILIALPLGGCAVIDALGGSDDRTEPPTGDGDGDGDAVDASMPFACNDDGAIEPNDLLSEATVTGIPDTGPSADLLGLALCPGFDTDVFEFRLDVNAIDVVADVFLEDAARGAPALEILNGGGTTILIGSVLSPDHVHASIPNVPAGRYYVHIGAPDGFELNYDLSIFTGPDLMQRGRLSGARGVTVRE